MAENSKDLQLLINDMEAVAEGHYDVSAADYDNPIIAEYFNKMLDGIVRRSNHFLMRINDAMTKVADVSYVKAMMEQVMSQQDSIKEFQETRLEFGNSVERINDRGAEILALSKQVSASTEPCIEQLDEAIMLLKVIESSPEMSENALTRVRTLVERSAQVLSGMEKRIKTAENTVGGLFEEAKLQDELAGKFLNSVESIAGNYEALSYECFNAGRQLFHISRDVDNARNDMYRKNSLPTLHDRLKVFAVDHVTLTWRLYNHIVEFEILKIGQLNAPKKCKFGVWYYGVTDKNILDSEAYKMVGEAHEELHNRAIACFDAKENSDQTAAMKEFENAQKALQKFLDALEAMHEFLRLNGIVDETPIWKYEGL